MQKILAQILARTEPMVTSPRKRRMRLQYPHLYAGPVTEDRKFTWNNGKNLDLSEELNKAAKAKFCEAFRLVNFTSVLKCDTFCTNSLCIFPH